MFFSDHDAVLSQFLMMLEYCSEVLQANSMTQCFHFIINSFNFL